MDGKMWSGILLFYGMAFLFSHHNVLGQDYGPCNSPLQVASVCRPRSDCPLIDDLVSQLEQRIPDILEQHLCVLVDGDPIVCCPIGGERQSSNNRAINRGNNNGNNNNNRNNNGNNNRNNNRNSNFQDNNNQYRRVNGVIQADNRYGYGPLQPPVCGIVDVKYTRIVNGVPAQLGAWPWAVLLGYRSRKNPSKTEWLCGGSLISSRHILTAAHCIHGQENNLYLVRLGELDISTDNDGATPIDVQIDRATMHPQYARKTITNDIGVLRLVQDVTFTKYIKPICLPVTDEVKFLDLTEYWPFVVGWGSLAYNGPAATRLQQLQLPFVAEEECREIYRGQAPIDYRQICAGHKEGGYDACKGDSGGPMMIPLNATWYSIGVVSYGKACATPGYPGVYSKTSAFLDFIINNLY